MKHRKPLPDIAGKESALLARIKARVKVNDTGCWEWQGFVGAWGYGLMSVKNKQHGVHRMAYLATHGTFDPYQNVCHTCDNPLCCNPAHLWLGTDEENQKDSARKLRHYEAAKTHCNRGHELAGDNLWLDKKNGIRNCRICDRASWRIRHGWPEELAFSLPPRQGVSLRGEGEQS